jgi:acyl-CoA thioester hydrolase
MQRQALNLDLLPITLRQEIPEEYRDIFGHMNVMWYTRLFGMSFGNFGEGFGFGREYMQANHVGSFALESHTRYLAEVHIGNHITVRSRLLGRSAKRLHFIHFMSLDETGALAATQENISAHIDMNIRRSSPFPELIATQLDKLLAEHNALDWQAPVCGSMKP